MVHITVRSYVHGLGRQLGGRSQQVPAALSPMASDLGIVSETPKVEIDDSRVWHYTDPSGLEGILSNPVIWASSADKMTDSGELLVGGKTLLDLLAKAESSIDPAVVDDVEGERAAIDNFHDPGPVPVEG